MHKSHSGFLRNMCSGLLWAGRRVVGSFSSLIEGLKMFGEGAAAGAVFLDTGPRMAFRLQIPPVVRSTRTPPLFRYHRSQ